MNERHKKALFFAALSPIFMSVESPLIKLSNLHWADVSFLIGIGLVISTNFMMALRGKKFLIQNYKIQYKGVLIGGLCAGFSNLSFVSAVVYGGVANTVLILSTAPIFSAIVMWIIFKKKTSKSIFLATFFIFLGLFIILKDDLNLGTILGTILAFSCVLCMIAIFISLSHFKRCSKIAYISVTGVCLSVVAFPFASFHVSLQSFMYIMFLGLFTMPLARYFLGLGTKHALPQEVSLLMILESVLAPLWAWWWLGDKPPLNTFIGGAIILTTLVLYIISTTKQESA